MKLSAIIFEDWFEEVYARPIESERTPRKTNPHLSIKRGYYQSLIASSWNKTSACIPTI